MYICERHNCLQKIKHKPIGSTYFVQNKTVSINQPKFESTVYILHLILHIYRILHNPLQLQLLNS